MNLNSSLLREKFVIDALDSEKEHSGLHICVCSNRMPIDLRSGGMEPESYVIRAHNMHSCTRMAGVIVNSYEQTGPIQNRNPPYDWDNAWNTVIDDYERAHNPRRWIAVYHKGRVIFEAGEHHSFLDIIEQCDSLNKSRNYEQSFEMARAAFKKAGKDVDIKYESNIALVVDIERMKGRCGMILRGPDRTTTFNMVIEAVEKARPLKTGQCITAAAGFLEGIQLAYMVGINLEKISLGEISPHSEEGVKTRDARKRLGRLNAEINTLENNVKVRYRPERPDFFDIVTISEELAKKKLEASQKAYQHSYQEE